MKKSTRIFLTIIILVVLISLGIIIYLRYTKSAEENTDVKVNNFYNSEYLFNNNYIEEANKIEKTSNIFKVNKDSVTINYLYKENKITDLPKDAKDIYYSKLNEGCFELATIVNNSLYYASSCITDKNSNSFYKIGNNVTSIYKLTTYMNDGFVNENPNTNFIIDTKKGNLKYISYKNNILGITNDLEEKRPYLDYICASKNYSMCKNLRVYITFQNELVLNSNIMKDENDKVIKAIDLFSTLSTSDTKVLNIDNLPYNILNKKKYKFDIYFLDKNHYLYLLSIDNSSIKHLPLIKKISDKKIKIIDYEKDTNGVIKKVIITDIDGKITNIFKTKYNTINLSTISERKPLTENLTK